LVDHDRVSLDNLHRQIAHSESTIGQPKVVSLRNTLHRLNPSVIIDMHDVAFTAENAESLVAKYVGKWSELWF